VKLLIGPWLHGQRSVTHAGDVDFGAKATLDDNIAPDHLTLRSDFFARYVRGDPVQDWLEAPVTVFVMGGGSGRRDAHGRLEHGGQWLRTSQWPPPDAVPQWWYITPDRALESEVNSQAFTAEWRHDPTDPVPTIGGAITSGAPVMEGGAFDQRESERFFGCRQPGRALDQRGDVVSFRSAPLTEDLQVIGPVRACLWVSTDRPDTDFVVKLIDEYPPGGDWPEGFAMNITDGILRLRFRESFERAVLAEPGQVYAIEVILAPTANRFMRGHRLRIDVASSNFPRFDVNPNTGAPAGVPSAPVVATNRLHSGPATPSHIELHIRPNR
jgi:putative CocE/NonD family hydrolase